MKKILPFIFFLFFILKAEAQWEQCSNGLKDSTIHALGVYEDRIIAGTCYGSIYVSTNNGDLWVQKVAGNGGPSVKSIAVHDSSIFVCALSKIYNSDDKGNSWVIKDSGLETHLGYYIYSIGFIENTILAGSISRIYKSTDNGESWLRIKKKGIGATSIAIIDTNIFVISHFDYLFVNMSTDYGQTWTSKQNGMTESCSKIYNYKNDLYAGCYNGKLYISKDNGDNWKLINEGVTHYPIRDILVFDNNIIIACDSCLYTKNENPPNGGIYVSTDNGLTWNSRNAGIGDKPTGVTSLVMKGDYIFTGTSLMDTGEDACCWGTGLGVFRRKISDFLTSVKETKISIKGVPSFCNGESVTLFAEPKGAEYSYLWSTGSKSDSIVVNKSGTYILKVTNKKGESARDTIKITINQKPVVEIKGDSLLCEGNESTLEATKGFSNYLWSTKDTTQTIYINLEGTYSVIATDNNGCRDTAEFLVKTMSWQPLIDNKDEINFDTVRAGIKSSQNKSLKNNQTETIQISFMSFVNNNVFSISSKEYPIEILPGDSIPIKIEFLPPKQQNYYDTLIIYIDEPCKTKRRIPISGIGIYSSVEDNFKDNFNWNLKPNPFSLSTELILNSSDSRLTEISLYNIFGKELKKIYSGVLDAGEQKFNISSEGLNSGIYFLRLQRGNEVKVLKLEFIR